MHATHEVTPAFPLHDPHNPWIPVQYSNGKYSHVDLTTLLKDAHKIDTINLEHVTAITALHRILLSIVYAYFQEDFPTSQRKWKKFLAQVIDSNEGFNPQWVDQYFSQWEDRFYLIHPTFPFLQDPSLVLTHNAQAYATTSDVNRESYAKTVESLDQLYPLSPSTNLSAGEKVRWGMPAQDSYKAQHDMNDKTRMLFITLMFSRYSHVAMRTKARSFLDSTVKPDEYTPISALRSATHFIPSIGNLYKNLVASMDFIEEDELEDDIPEWEWDVNEYGFLGLRGKTHSWYDLVKSVDAPRSSINMSHIAILFIPEYDTENNTMSIEHVGQCRRILFNFRHLTVTNEHGKKVKMPSPITWNPYVAHTSTGTIMRQGEGLSPKTALSNSTLFKVALLPESEKVVTPSALANARSKEIESVTNGMSRVSILVHAADIVQDKNYNSFVIKPLIVRSALDNAEKAGIVDQWLSIGTRSWRILHKNVDVVYKGNFSDSQLAGMSHSYWSTFGEIFSEAMSNDCAPVGAYRDTIMDILRGLYKEYTQQFFTTNPLLAIQHENILLGATYNWITQQASERSNDEVEL